MVRLVSDKAEYRAQYTALYEAAFPADERRATAVWIDMDHKEFCRYAVLRNEQFAGFVTVWNFERFVYVEHFAILPELRGLGIGAEVLKQLREYYKLPLVLEVEMPEDELARRRVGFYERCGLTLCERDYLQPPYDTQSDWLPMRLMTSDMTMTEEQFASVCDCLYRAVYGCEDGYSAKKKKSANA